MITFVQMSTLPYDFMVQRPQQIMKALNIKGHKVFYIESKCGNYLIEKRMNFFILSEDYDFINTSIDNPIVLWCSSPQQVLNADKFPHDYIVYDVADEASEEFIYWEPYIDLMVTKADIIFTSSENLFNKFKLRHKRVHLIKNGVDITNFNISKKDVPKDLPINKKIVGYVGSISPWINWDMLGNTVKNSDYNFVFVGPLYGRHRINIIGNNVHYLGYKNYEELPYYINNFNCCIIPFMVTEMTNGCNPIKFYEYCALGKPVVSTAVKEMTRFNEICYLSESEEEFKKNIDLAINENCEELKKHRMLSAENNSWNERAKCILSILNQEFNIK